MQSTNFAQKSLETVILIANCRQKSTIFNGKPLFLMFFALFLFFHCCPTLEPIKIVVYKFLARIETSCCSVREVILL